jgi:hypothetical protein
MKFKHPYFPILPVFLAMTLLWPIACGKNLPNTTTGPLDQATPAPTMNPSTGIAWFNTTTAAFPGFSRFGHTSLVFDGRMWTLGGANTGSALLNDVWYSADGTQWTEALANNSAPGTIQFSQRFNHTSVVFNNLMWVLGGSTTGGTAFVNDVWSSPDGVNWTMAVTNNASGGTTQFSQRDYQASVVFNNKIWVIGGTNVASQFNDVWYSSDGTTWTQSLPNTATPGTTQFSQRYGHTSVAYNGLMWVIGGGNGTTCFNDVWSSPDGQNWTKVLANNSSAGTTQFSQRWGHASVVYDGLMWVIGGRNSSGFFNDVWYSSDGVIWRESTKDASFSPRLDFTYLAFNNEMWVIAGINGGTILNDVWETP